MECTSRGFSIHYTRDGDGPSLVVIPGNMQCARHWAELGYVEALSDSYRVMAIDPLGHGGSDRPHDPAAYRVRDIAADVIAVLDAEGIEKAILWGHSRGSGVATATATLYPRRVEGLILGAHQFGAPPNPGAGDIARRRVDFLEEGDWDGFIAGLTTAFPEFRDPAVSTWLRGDNDLLAIAASFGGPLLEEPLAIDVGHLRGRILLYIGSDETWLQAPDALDQLRQRCTDAGVRLEIIPGAGHLQSFFQAATVLPTVREHLETVLTG